MASSRGIPSLAGYRLSPERPDLFKEVQTMTLTRPETFILHNGDKAPLPFDISEYDARLAKLRSEMAARGIDAVLLTSMQTSPIIQVSCIAALDAHTLAL